MKRPLGEKTAECSLNFVSMRGNGLRSPVIGSAHMSPEPPLTHRSTSRIRPSGEKPLGLLLSPDCQSNSAVAAPAAGC